MTKAPTTVSLPTPRASGGVPADVISAGQPIPAIDRIKIFGDKQWEEFVLEWADSLRGQYVRVERCGGSGDMGRDIIAMFTDNELLWDNYQCKHYKEPLRPSDIWVELGKLVHYTYNRKYSYPRRYCFVAPQGAGTRLSNLLRKPDELRSELIANWATYCRTGITTTATVELGGDLRAYLDGLDFSIFEAIPPLRLIDAHAKTRWHVARFGGGLPIRPPSSPPPAAPSGLEATYLRRLLDAYGDHLKRQISTLHDVATEPDLQEHLNDSRVQFYSAESLRAFSRDTLPPGEFEQLQDEVHMGIRDEVRSDHVDGYSRVIAVVKTARSLQLTAHALISRLTVFDRGGMCHQLANDGKVRWVPE